MIIASMLRAWKAICSLTIEARQARNEMRKRIGPFEEQ